MAFPHRQDYQSEKFIQATLDRASKGRTTITVSHRISAIRSADRIVFIEKGSVAEDGTHNQLMAMKGRYHEMITAGNLFDDDKNLVDSEATTAEDDHTSGQQKMISTNNSDETDFQQFSIDDTKDEPATKSKDDSIQYWTLLIRTLKLARPEWLSITSASIAALVIGTACPIFAILFGEMFGVCMEIM